MSVVARICNTNVSFRFRIINVRQMSQETEFRVLNLRSVKTQSAPKRKVKKMDVPPPRYHQMAVDQDWGSVWPGPRSFHPATVPLPLRQGYVEKGVSPHKFANAELMKIPNFLHLTPPVIARQCEALQRFCTAWPRGLETDEQCERHFPIEVATSNYCYSSPSVRDATARIVTVRVKLARLALDARAKDKFRRLMGDKYDEETDYVTIVTDRCPLRQQNYDYAMYLLTAVFHEAWRVEPWEQLKSENDMEYYDWSKSKSRQNLESLFGKAHNEIANAEEYSQSLSTLMNEGENEYLLTRYAESVKKLLGLPVNAC